MPRAAPPGCHQSGPDGHVWLPDIRQVPCVVRGQGQCLRLQRLLCKSSVPSSPALRTVPADGSPGENKFQRGGEDREARASGKEAAGGGKVWPRKTLTL